MIDVESKVITAVDTAIGNNATVGSLYTNAPSSFPYISVIEEDNTIAYEDDGDAEKYSKIMYEVNVYTNDDAKKSSARALLKTVDDVMYRFNFTRTYFSALPNMDSTIYRLMARYEAVTDGTTFYRR